jgi:hypothetical protein
MVSHESIRSQPSADHPRGGALPERHRVRWCPADRRRGSLTASRPVNPPRRPPGSPLNRQRSVQTRLRARTPQRIQAATNPRHDRESSVVGSNSGGPCSPGIQMLDILAPQLEVTNPDASRLVPDLPSDCATPAPIDRPDARTVKRSARLTRQLIGEFVCGLCGRSSTLVISWGYPAMARGAAANAAAGRAHPPRENCLRESPRAARHCGPWWPIWTDHETSCLHLSYGQGLSQASMPSSRPRCPRSHPVRTNRGG